MAGPERGGAARRVLRMGDHSYPYHYGYGWGEELAERVLACDADRYVVVTDDRVLELHGEPLLRALRERSQVLVLSRPPGEAAKSMNVLAEHLEQALDWGATRRSVVVTLGGGVPGNLGGLVAALLFRGVRLVHVPTTIVAAMDSVISLKQAINGRRGKNVVGAYHAPSAVLVDLELLDTLPDRERRSGVCESIKNCLALRPRSLDRIDAVCRAVREGPLPPEMLAWLLEDSLDAKLAAMKDDAGERRAGMALEYGHTVGHAIELLDHAARGPEALSHGEAIGIGMVAAARVANRRGWLEDGDVRLHEALLSAAGAPTRIPAHVEPAGILELVQRDNKRGALEIDERHVPLVLLRRLGEPAGEAGLPLVPVTIDELAAALPTQEERPRAPARSKPSRPDPYGPEPDALDERRVFDVCVVGSGAAGSIAAWRLARAGLDVLVVERGPYVDADTSYDDVLADCEPAWVRQDNGAWARAGHAWTTCNVGGGTVFYGGASFRHRLVDFDAGSVLHGSELPLAWPWDPGELGTYYDTVEQLLGVAGDADADAGAPPRSVPYLLPAVEPSPEGAALAEGARRLGLDAVPTPLAIALSDHDGRPGCTRDHPCISNRCPSGSKADGYELFLRPAVEAGARLLAGLNAVRLERGPGEEVEALVCVRAGTGRTHRFRARRFVLACNAVQTAALLLRSRDRHSPHGLGNANGIVGRGLCFKLSEYVVGYRRVQGAGGGSRTQGLGPFSTVCVLDHYADPCAPGGLGGLIYEAQPEQRIGLGADEQVLRVECLVPDEPRRENRVRIRDGEPARPAGEVVMDYQPHPRDLARLEYLVQRGEELLRAAGCDVVVREPSGWQLGSCHLHGTCRSGQDPLTSVTAPDGRLHDVANVHVADGALLPFPGAVNPTLTIQALALRTADALAGSASTAGTVPAVAL